MTIEKSQRCGPAGYGYVRRLPGVDVDRLGSQLRDSVTERGFELQEVIIDDDGREFVRLLRLVEIPETAGPVFVPRLRHLRGRSDLVLLCTPVYLTYESWIHLERWSAPDVAVSSR
jgi:hypothetical protein